MMTRTDIIFASNFEPAELYELYFELFKSTGMENHFCKPSQFDDAVRWVERYTSEHRIIVKVENGLPIALAHINPGKQCAIEELPEIGELFGIVVGQKERKKGHGADLVKVLQHSMNYITTKPVTKNAKYLFKSMGFGPSETKKHFWEWIA